MALGAGIVIAGRLYRGSRCYAGEISHMHVYHLGYAVANIAAVLDAAPDL